MRDRFLALFGPRNEAVDRLLDRMIQGQAATRIAIVERSERRLLVTDRRLPVIALPSGRGYVLGDLFRQDETGPIGELPRSIAASGGRVLVDFYWGRYVALIEDAPGAPVEILRDPSGAIECVHARVGGALLVTSDVGFATRVGLLRPQVDWDFAAHFLAYPHLPLARTGLIGLRSTRPGCCDAVSNNDLRTLVYWTPWRYAASERRLTSLQAAGEQLRDRVASTVDALARPFQSILLELSGGLDSSIVAAALAAAARKPAALNIATEGPEGDERHHARAVADRLALRLFDRTVSLAEPVDLRRSPAAGSPRPGVHAAVQLWDRAVLAAARDGDHDACFSGTGGDNVFCSLATAAPVADRAMAAGFGPGTMATIADVAAVHGCTLWTAIRLAIRQLRRARRVPGWPHDPRFLARDAIPMAAEPHPWLDEPAGSLPGTRAHIRSIMVAQAHMHGSERQRFVPLVLPLLAQPVMELCLAIPTWLWVAEGRERAVARHAFAGALPDTIVRRRTKGTMTAYCGEIFLRNRPVLRELLLDGGLAREGIVDRAAAEAALAAPGPLRGDDYFRLLAMADVEAWAQSWDGC
jgi:asparagine synthase (glutamine-hydrolysing)